MTIHTVALKAHKTKTFVEQQQQDLDKLLKKGKRMKPTWRSSKTSLLKCRTDLASPSFHTCACMLSTLQLVIAVRAGGGPGSRVPSATRNREADGHHSARNKILTGPSCVRKFPFVREFCFCQDRTHARGASGSCGSNAPPEVAFPSGPPVPLAPAAAVSLQEKLGIYGKYRMPVGGRTPGAAASHAAPWSPCFGTEGPRSCTRRWWLRTICRP